MNKSLRFEAVQSMGKGLGQGWEYPNTLGTVRSSRPNGHFHLMK
ncbi:MAG: hypothetical protein ACI9TH_003035 [Kiritimatiellia bacterium]|jgi:hypothetical protein